jgi:hypothetical protein
MPPRIRNRIGTTRSKLSLDRQTQRVLDDLVPLGIYGKTMPEVASYIIRTWLRENREELKEFGVRLVKKLRESKKALEEK